MSLSLLVALSLQILFLFTILKCMLAKMGGFSNKMQLPQTFVMLFWCEVHFLFSFIISIIIFLLMKVYAGNYIC